MKLISQYLCDESAFVWESGGVCVGIEELLRIGDRLGPLSLTV